MKSFFLLAAFAVMSLLSSCSSVDPAAKLARDAIIRTEPPGNYMIGRRYHTNGCRFWGYLRSPGQLWETSKLVVMQERNVKQPDRLPESPDSGNAHGYDHNREYRVYGGYTGRKVYDPNADLELPEFLPSKFEVISSQPGFLFSPEDRYDPRYMHQKEYANR